MGQGHKVSCPLNKAYSTKFSSLNCFLPVVFHISEPLINLDVLQFRCSLNQYEIKTPGCHFDLEELKKNEPRMTKRTSPSTLKETTNFTFSQETFLSVCVSTCSISKSKCACTHPHLENSPVLLQKSARR